MKTKKISITKYNPIYRNKLGHFQRDEWTSISDIGKVYNGKIFTYSDYEHFEDLYLKAIFNLMSFFGSKEIKIIHLFKYSQEEYFDHYDNKNLYDVFNSLKKNDVITDLSLIEKLIKLRLRELIAELEILIDEDSNSKILFGFDYYMYLQTRTDKDLLSIKQKIEDLGLFVK